jgi:ABC-type lipoprotein release transport system permease subunit
MDAISEQYNLPDRMYPQLSVLSALLGPGIVFLGGLLAAIYPSLRLYLLQPVAAMRAV